MVDVTAAIIIKDNKLLIAQRLENSHRGLRWEFPGGKIEDGETPEVTLKRELKEELDIDAVIEELFLDTTHIYPEKTVRLISFLVKSFQGEIKMNSHHKIKWIDFKDLDKYKFCEADVPIVEKLKFRQKI